MVLESILPSVLYRVGTYNIITLNKYKYVNKMTLGSIHVANSICKGPKYL